MARILLVDDSFTARRIIVRLLGAEHEFVEADGGNAALAALETDAFSAVLLDLLMPGVDGFETLRNIKSRHPELPVVVVSADIQDTTRSRLIQAGASAIVHKPVRREELQEAIRNATERT